MTPRKAPAPASRSTSVAQQLAGTPAGGLARLAAGLEWLDAGRPAGCARRADPPRRRQDAAPRPRPARGLPSARGARSAGRSSALRLSPPPTSRAAESPAPPCPKAAELLDRTEPEGQGARGPRARAAECPRRGSRGAAGARHAAARPRRSRGGRRRPRPPRPRVSPAPEAKQARARLAALAARLPPRTARRARTPAARARHGAARRGAHHGGARVPARRAAREPRPRGRRPRARAARARAPVARKAHRRPRPAAQGRGRVAARGRGRLPPRRRHGPPNPRASSLRGGRRPLPGDALGRGGAAVGLANHYQKDARDDEALPYYRRLLADYPEGRYVERAAWRVGWGDYRAGRFEEAAQTFEKAARRRPAGNVTPGLLYWAGRARQELATGRPRARALPETVRRYKHAYHGVRAREALPAWRERRVPPACARGRGDPRRSRSCPSRARRRARQLLLIDRLDEAPSELRLLPATPARAGDAGVDRLAARAACGPRSPR